ncbi:MAG: Crp/Fnr family transcriptional regulator [Dactylosporangium sp.]|nr:Crp/Fnr family transcriptional regulator [Dactylosporangium sp.]NNJ60145.1 Crp/Fnr family transcriptional regulator [Dactylosporangium sp.]
MAGHLHLDPQQRSALCAVGVRRRYRPGTLVFREGDHCDSVLVVLHGTVKISSTATSGYETVLAVRSAGEVVGELAAFDQRPRSTSVLALSDIDSVLITGDDFRAYLRSQPDLTLAMLSGMVHRLRESDRRRLEFGAYDVTGRLARLLLELAERHGRPTGNGRWTTITVALSQRELAGAVGASREAVARSLRVLRRHRAIATRRLRITVLRVEVLRSLGGEYPLTEPFIP